MQKSESNFAVEAAQGDRSYASIEEAAAHAVQLQAELTAEREMHQQARGAMTELHLSNAALGEALKETQQQLKQAKGAAGMNKKRRFLMTYMDPVVVLEQHLLQEKSRALDATVVGLREEILALQCQKDGNTQASYGAVEKLQRTLEENNELARQVHEMRAMQMEHSKIVQDLQMRLGEAQSWASQLEKEREALAAKCYTLEQELNQYKRRS